MSTVARVQPHRLGAAMRSSLAGVPLYAERLRAVAARSASLATWCWRPPGRCSPGRRATSRWPPSPSSASAPIRWRCWASAALPAGAAGRGAGRVAVALVVGLATLRLAGVYFVIFTFGLTELIRQLVTWYEVNITGTSAATSSSTSARRNLLAAAGARRRAVPDGWWCERSRLGLALRIIGDDEVVARHSRHRRHARQGGAVCAQRRHHDADRRDHGAALDLYRSGDRLQSDHLVPGGDHGAARRRAAPVGAAARRHPAHAAVRMSDGQFSEPLFASCSAWSSSLIVYRAAEWRRRPAAREAWRARGS